YRHLKEHFYNISINIFSSDKEGTKNKSLFCYSSTIDKCEIKFSHITSKFIGTGSIQRNF
ncbi:MAG: hypothetical protein LUG96_14635, partial [Tannerellaceae bacterium]|nr:hypothetical protein [Tannerellaceae bacterium]